MTNLTTYFIYLDDLRESGVVNMFGAPWYLVDTFKLKHSDAQRVVRQWIETFGDGTATAADRARVIDGLDIRNRT